MGFPRVHAPPRQNEKSFSHIAVTETDQLLSRIFPTGPKLLNHMGNPVNMNVGNLNPQVETSCPFWDAQKGPF